MYKDGKSYTLSTTTGDIQLMERGKEVMRKIGLGNEVDECTFHWAKFSDPSILGAYKDNTVYISVKHEESVFEWMLQTMFEELMHHKTGFADGRLFQDYFIGFSLKLLLEKHDLKWDSVLPLVNNEVITAHDNEELSF